MNIQKKIYNSVWDLVSGRVRKCISVSVRDSADELVCGSVHEPVRDSIKISIERNLELECKDYEY